jgi:hypothetical protein
MRLVWNPVDKKFRVGAPTGPVWTGPIPADAEVVYPEPPKQEQQPTQEDVLGSNFGWQVFSGIPEAIPGVREDTPPTTFGGTLGRTLGYAIGFGMLTQAARLAAIAALGADSPFIAPVVAGTIAVLSAGPLFGRVMRGEPITWEDAAQATLGSLPLIGRFARNLKLPPEAQGNVIRGVMSAVPRALRTFVRFSSGEPVFEEAFGWKAPEAPKPEAPKPEAPRTESAPTTGATAAPPEPVPAAPEPTAKQAGEAQEAQIQLTPQTPKARRLHRSLDKQSRESRQQQAEGRARAGGRPKTTAPGTETTPTAVGRQAAADKAALKTGAKPRGTPQQVRALMTQVRKSPEAAAESLFRQVQQKGLLDVEPRLRALRDEIPKIQDPKEQEKAMQAWHDAVKILHTRVLNLVAASPDLYKKWGLNPRRVNELFTSLFLRGT